MSALADSGPSEPDAFDSVEEMIVSASHSPRGQASMPSFTTVLDGKDLESSPSTSLADALRFVPGLQLTQQGARGGRASLSLRGLDPNHVVVLVDGVRLNDPTNSRGGSFDPTTLALLDVERIEIIRGPKSSIYGSDAIAGVVNVITRKATIGDDPTARLSVRGGRFHQGSVVAEGSGSLGGAAALTIGASLDTFRDPNSHGGYDGANAKMKLNAELPLSIDLEAFARIHRSSSRSFPDSSGGPEVATLRQLADRNVREISFGLALEREIPLGGKFKIRASRASRREDLQSPGVNTDPTNPFNFNLIPSSTAGDEYKRWDLSLVSSWLLPKVPLLSVETQTKVVTGTAFIWEDGESDTTLGLPFCGNFTTNRCPFYDHRRTIGVFVEVEESIGPYVVASGSVRFDSISSAPNHVSPAAGLAIEIPGTPVVLFGNYSEGFKRPSFYSVGNPIVGNRSLLAEKSRGWEAGLRGHTNDGRFSAQLSYFDLVVKDIIDFDAAAFKLVNRSRLISRGVEIELNWQPVEWLEWRAGAIFNPTDFKGTSKAPPNRSRWRGSSSLVLTPLDTLEMSLRMLAVSSTKATSFHTGAQVHTLAGYVRVDLRVAWQPREFIELFVEIQNLTNRTYREAVGFEAPGIGPRLGLTLRH